jgi:nitrite reductase/ring-hydroxylating ferredoxin subunit
VSRHVVATVDEIPPGGRKVVDVAGRSIGVFNVGGEFFALRNRCPHQGGPLCEGRLSGFLRSPRPGEYEYSRKGEILRCAWHGWEFDVRTGQSWFDPKRTRVRRYEVTVEAGGESGRAPSSPGASSPGAEEEGPEAEDEGLEKGPYVAETYPVSVERQYVVVELDS